MNETNAWDVIDTIAKVGLGAMIAAISTYIISKLNHKKDIEKEREKEERELFLGIVNEIDKFHNCLLDFIHRIPIEKNKLENHDELLAKRLKAQADNLEFNPTQLKTSINEVQEQSKSLINSRSKLILLGYDKCVESLNKYKIACENFWLESSITENRISSQEYSNLKYKVDLMYREMYTTFAEYFPMGITNDKKRKTKK